VIELIPKCFRWNLKHLLHPVLKHLLRTLECFATSIIQKKSHTVKGSKFCAMSIIPIEEEETTRCQNMTLPLRFEIKIPLKSRFVGFLSLTKVTSSHSVACQSDVATLIFVGKSYEEQN